MKPRFIPRFAAFSSAIVICIAASAIADQTWNGSTNAFWNEAGNWTTAVPGSGDVVIFDSTSTANLSTTLGQDLSVLGLRVVDPAGTVSVAAGNTLTIGASGVDMSSATQNLTLNGPISISTGQSWNIATGRTLTSNGIITAAGILTKTGAGNLILTNANTISGGINVSAGQLTTNNSSALGSNALTLSNGTTYRYERTTTNTNTTITNAISVAGSSSVTITTNNAANVYNGIITGDANSTVNIGAAGAITQCSFSLGANTQQFGPFLGRVEIFDGASLRFSTTSNLNNGGSSAIWDTNTSGQIVSRNGGTVNLGSLVGSGEIVGPGGADGTVTYVIGARGENCTFDGTIRNSTAARIAALTKTGAATLKLTSATGLTYTGATNVNEGTLMVNGTKTGGGSITVRADAILAGTGSLAGITTVQGFGVVSPGDPAVSSGIGNLSFANLTLSADSILDLDFGTGNDTATVSSGGTLTLNSGAKVDVGGFGTDGTYTLIPYSGASVVGVASTALSVLNGNPAKIYVIKDTGSAIVLEISSNDPNNFWDVDGGGTWNAAGNWTKTLIPNGIEAIARIGPGVGGTGTPFSSSPLTITLDANQTVGTLAIDDATAFSIDPGANPAHSLLFDNGVSASILSINSGSQIINAPVAVDAQGLALSVGTGASLTMNGQLSGASAAVTKSGDGPLTLAGPNSYGGGTTLGGGTIIIGDDAALGDAAGALTFTGGTLRLAAGLSGVTRSFQVSGSSNARIDTNGFDFDYAGAISPVGGGTGGLVKTGTGYLALSAPQSYTGSTLVDRGRLILSSGGAISGTTLGMTAATGVLFHVDGGSFSGTTGTVPINATGFRISSGTATFSGSLTAPNNDAGTALIRVEGGDLNAASIAVGRAASTVAAEPAAGATNAGLVISEVDPESPTTVDITGALTVAGSNSTANARMDGGTVTVGGIVSIGLNNTLRWSVLDVNGGTFLSTDAATGVQLGNGSAGNAAFIVQDGGVAKVNKLTFRADGTAAYNGIVKVLPLGSLYVGSGGMVRTGTNALCSTTVKHEGGLIGASADWSSPINVSLSAIDCEFKAADELNAPFNITLNGVVSGTGNLLKKGTGTLTLGALNTYTGNTSVDEGQFILANDAGLTFVIGDNGVNNRIQGPGSATIEGDFTFDLTAAAVAEGNSWTIVSGTNKTFADTFSVTGFADPENDGTWTFTDGNSNS